QDGERLPDFVVQAGVANLLEVNGVGALEERDLLPIDVSEDADAESRAREWMPPDHLFGQTKLATDVPHLVLEQLTQRLDEPELHVRLEPADVVVRLDRHRGTATRRQRLDHVRVE